MSCLDELEDGKEYVCSGKGEIFKKIDYAKPEIVKGRRTSNAKFIVQSNPPARISPPDCVRPRIVTLIRNGIKPRKVSIFLLLIFKYIFIIPRYFVYYLFKYKQDVLSITHKSEGQFFIFKQTEFN